MVYQNGAFKIEMTY